MNAICDTTAKSETLSVKGCKAFLPVLIDVAYHYICVHSYSFRVKLLFRLLFQDGKS